MRRTIIGQLKRLKHHAVPEDVLRRHRGFLTARLDAHPALRPPARFGLVRSWKPLMAGIASAAVLSAGGGTVLAAQASLPGDSLYEVKTAVEEVRAALSFSEGSRYRVRAEQAERRLTEAREVMKRPKLPRPEREQRLQHAMKRLDEHLFDLNVMAVQFGAKPPKAKISAEAEASLERVLERHEELVESAVAVDEETERAILRPIADSLELEDNVLRSVGLKAEARFKERLQKRSERLRERLERHEAEEKEDIDDEDEDEEIRP